MIPNRIAAGTQAVAIAVTVTTANRPLHLGWLHGPPSIALGWTAATFAVLAFVRPGNQRTEAASAGACCTFWALRALYLTLETVHGAPLATAAAVHAALAIHTGLFAYRTIIRYGFYRRLEQVVSDA